MTRRHPDAAPPAVENPESLFRSAFEDTHVAMVVTDLDHRFVRANAAFARLFGYTPAEVLRLSMPAVTHPDDLDASLTNREPLLAAAADYFQMEKRYRHKDGRVFWGLTNVSLVRDAAGRPSRYVGQVQDITERKAAEAAVRASEARYRAVVEGSLQGVVVHQDGRIRHVNAAGCQMYGYADPAELVGRPWEVLVAPEDRAALQARAAATLAGERMPPHAGWQGVRKDGRRIWLESIVCPIRVDDRPAVAAFLIDITERKKLEEQFRQAQKMEAVGRLAGGVAHDFNNLLTVINGYAELLLATGDPAAADRPLLREVLRAGERAAALTRQLLAFSHKQLLVPVVLDLNALLGDMVRMLTRLIGADVDLRLVCAPDLGRVKVDPGQLEQVVMNLVVNARDAMPRGGKVTVETANVDLDAGYAAAHLGAAPGPYVLLAVTDTGCGMDAATVAQVFEPFFTTKGPGKGTGLGLSIVHGVVKQSGGRVEVYSEPGIGTTFKVYLPRVGDAVAAPRPAPPAARPRRGTETVLLVEDEEGVRTLARVILERYGYRVLEAADGAEALDVARREADISLLVTDLVMPNVSGPELAARLSAVRPGLPVLFLSGYADDAVIHHGMITPDTPFLQKPFTQDGLAGKVREVLGEPDDG